MGTPKIANEQDNIKELLKKEGREYSEKAKEVFKSIEKDLNEIKYLSTDKKEEILQKVLHYADCCEYSHDFFLRSMVD